MSVSVINYWHCISIIAGDYTYANVYDLFTTLVNRPPVETGYLHMQHSLYCI